MAKFSRSSTAYKQDGSVVAAGVPRFESNGVMVEEGTTNLIPKPNPTALTDYPTRGGNIEWLNGVHFFGSGYAYQTSPVLSLTTYVVSCDISMDDGGIPIPGLSSIAGDFSLVINNDVCTAKVSVIDKGNGIYRVSGTQIVSAIHGTNTGIVKSASHSSRTFTVIGNLQLEAKPYATSFHPTTRTAESLTVPASALNATEGTIEFDCYVTANTKALSGNHSICSIYVAGNSNRLQLRHMVGGYWQIIMYNPSGNNIDRTFIENYIIVGNHRLSIAYSAESFRVFVDGVKIVSVLNPVLMTEIPSPLYLGSFAGVSEYSDALFSNLRISNKARTDAELANTGALAVDEYTTYFLSMNGNLSATCHPVMLVQGQGQVLLSRVGRGTRAIKVQGSGQVKLKRSAQYYPTIAVGTKGEVQLSRQGIGYRKMKVEGQGSFKIQEPNIEIYPEIREREATTNIIERQATTEVIGVPYAGDTIKIKGSFKTFEGVLADPASITLKIYDTINNLLTTINVTATNKISAGVYEVNYTIPDGYQALYYEWHCVQGDSPQVTMGKITVLKRGQA